MKNFGLLCALIMYNGFAYAQTNTIERTENFWMTVNGEIVNIDSIGSYNSALRNIQGFELHGLICYRFIDTISCQNHYYNLSLNPDSLIVDKYDFVVQKETNENLLLTANSKLSKKFMGNKRLELFPYLSLASTEEFEFKGLDMINPGFEIHIDTNKNIYYERLHYSGLSLIERRLRDSSKDGMYRGKISEEDYEELVMTLAASGITVGEDFNNMLLCSHCTTTTLKVQYNNNSEEYRYNMSRLSLHPLNKLINRLTDLERLEKIN